MRREIYIFHPKGVCASPGVQKLVFLSEFTFVLPAMHRPGLSIVIGLSCIENIYSRYGSGEKPLCGLKKIFAANSLVTASNSKDAFICISPESFSPIMTASENQYFEVAQWIDLINEINERGYGSQKVSYTLITRSRARKNARSHLRALTMTVKKDCLTAS